MILAIIDLGSNSVRMDIVEIDEASGKYKYLDRLREMARLSEGMNMDGCLREEAMELSLIHI